LNAVRVVSIHNLTKNTVIATKGTVADRFLTRMIGLLSRPSLPPGEALIIKQCQSIHMFFMRFAIDAIFVDRKHCVVGLVKRIKPFQLSPIFFRSSYVIEVNLGTIVQSETSLGDTIKIIYS
jgi:uncharacterized membrane protein (UPF0127 family)